MIKSASPWSKRWLFMAAVAFLAGAVLSRLISPNMTLCIIIGALFAAVFCFRRLCAFFIGAVFCLSMAAMTAVLADPLPEMSTVVLSGRVESLKQNDDYYVYKLTPCTAEDSEGKKELPLGVYLSSPQSDIRENDIITAETKLRRPQGPAYEYAFDDELYCASQRVGWRGYAASIERTGRANDLSSFLDGIRADIGKHIDEKFAEQAGFAKAILLGDKSGLSAESLEALRSTGIAHIVVVSGLHVGFLCAVMLAMMRRLRAGRKTRFFVTLSVLAVYALLAGLTVSVVRVLVMTSVMLFADLAGRRPDALTSLSLAFLILVIPNPAQIFDVGFQLSFAAVFALLCLAPVLSAGGGAAVKSMASCVAASIGTSPLLINISGKFTFISVALNAVVIPFCGAVFPLVMAAVLLSYIPAVFDWLCFAASRCLWAIDALAKLLCGAGELQIPFIAPYLIVIIYMTVFLFSKYVTLNIKKKFAICGAAAIGIAVCVAAYPRSELKITWLDVGAADCAVIESGEDTILIDTAEKDRAADYMKKHGLYADVTLISHAHDDHTGDLAELSEQGRAGAVLAPPSELAAIKETTGVEAQAINSGESLFCGDDIELRVLYAGTEPKDDANESSMVVLLCYKGENICLFTGDAETRQELEAVPAYMQTEILKVAHHGSKTSDSSEFFGRVSPQIAVVSNGRAMRKELIEHLGSADVYDTYTCGTVTAFIDSGDIRLETAYECG